MMLSITKEICLHLTGDGLLSGACIQTVASLRLCGAKDFGITPA